MKRKNQDNLTILKKAKIQSKDVANVDSSSTIASVSDEEAEMEEFLLSYEEVFFLKYALSCVEITQPA
eukprot:Pgem_evm1s11259